MGQDRVGEGGKDGDRMIKIDLDLLHAHRSCYPLVCWPACLLTGCCAGLLAYRLAAP